MAGKSHIVFNNEIKEFIDGGNFISAVKGATFDTDIAAALTIDGFKTTIDAYALHQDQQPRRTEWKKKVDLLKLLAVIDDAQLVAATGWSNWSSTVSALKQ